jgi:hypothetical protein
VVPGSVWGRLTVIGPHQKNESSQVQWTVRCACGTKTLAWGYNLVKGKKTDCGCGRSPWKARGWEMRPMIPPRDPVNPLTVGAPPPPPPANTHAHPTDPDYTTEWRAWRKMARAMAELIPKDLFHAEDVERAGGQVLCKTCRIPFSLHPEAWGMPTFHLICSGDVVKT